MQERILSLLMSDVTVPGEYLETLRRTKSLEPEKELLLAILEDAIHCFQKYCFAEDPAGRALFQEAQTWITQTGDDWIFSFENVCELLGLDPQYLRRGLFEWKQKAVQQRKSAGRKAQGNRAA